MTFSAVHRPAAISTGAVIGVSFGSWAVNLEQSIFFSGFPPITDVWTGLAVHKERRDRVCGIPCAPLQQSGRDDGKGFAVERADRRDQRKTKRTAENKIY
jgi:hypothetical protein